MTKSRSRFFSAPNPALTTWVVEPLHPAHARHEALVKARTIAQETKPFTQAVADRWVEERRRILNEVDSRMGYCTCKAPRRGEPLCPCRMLNTLVVGGRYLLIGYQGPGQRASVEDVGPVLPPATTGDYV